jgi:hypothetical protein
MIFTNSQFLTPPPNLTKTLPSVLIYPNIYWFCKIVSKNLELNKCHTFLLFNISRLGIGPGADDEKNTEEEVNDYLARAIDARSIDRLRTEHCKRFFLSFRDKEIEVSC